MSTSLPAPIAAFIQAMNARDTNALLASLAADAVIADEGHEHGGRAAIAAWSDMVNREYQVSVDVRGVVQQGDETIVSALVSGAFDGSPLPFRYHFVLAGDKIAAMRVEG